jgi:hypothetical protein
MQASGKREGERSLFRPLFPEGFRRYFLLMGKVKVAPSHPMLDTSGTKDRMSIK